MVNEVAVVLLYGLLGWKVAALYMGTGLVVAIVSGFVIGRLGMERHLEDWVPKVRVDTGADGAPEPTWAARLDAGARAVRDFVGRVWPWVVGGIAVGAGINGYVPEARWRYQGSEALVERASSVVRGIPMYSNAAGMIPCPGPCSARRGLGTVLAFMMAVIALSLPRCHPAQVIKARLTRCSRSGGRGILLVAPVQREP
jgi:uncharacterized membrane protein YraQ (UPF0718 family)